MQNKIIHNLLHFYSTVEKLKATGRHSWTSDPARQESSAEHSWMLSLIAITLFDHIRMPVDQLRVLKILIVHDLAEAITGDIPAHDLKRRENKKVFEKAAFEELVKDLEKYTKAELLSLWYEYEANESDEARLAQAIDKLEAPLQHNIADISTWDENDFAIHPFYKMEYSSVDDFIRDLRLEIESMSKAKIEKAGKMDSIHPDHKKRYTKLIK